MSGQLSLLLLPLLLLPCFLRADDNTSTCLRCAGTRHDYALDCAALDGGSAQFCSAALADCSALQVACLLDACWQGPLVLGADGNILSFASARAVRQFLRLQPVDETGALIAELVAATLNDRLFPVYALRLSPDCPLAVAPSLLGLTVEQLLDLANLEIAGHGGDNDTVQLTLALAIYNQARANASCAACLQCNETVAPTAQPTESGPLAPGSSTGLVIGAVLFVALALLGLAIAVGLLYRRVRRAPSPNDRLHPRRR